MHDEYRYYVNDTVADTRIEVRFETLLPHDIEILDGDDWIGSRFGEVWKMRTGRPGTLKLVSCSEVKTQILGILSHGIVQIRRDGLRNSLIEVCPAHKFGSEARRYSGLGSVLVARLVIESMEQGGEGRLLIRPVVSSKGFYKRLGFTKSLVVPYLRLQTAQASVIIENVTKI